MVGFTDLRNLRCRGRGGRARGHCSIIAAGAGVQTTFVLAPLPQFLQAPASSSANGGDRLQQPQSQIALVDYDPDTGDPEYELPETGLLQKQLDELELNEELSQAGSEDDPEGKGLDADPELPPAAPAPPSGDPNKKKTMSKFAKQNTWHQYRPEGLSRRGYFVANPNGETVTAHCKNPLHGSNCRATMVFKKEHGLSVALAPMISH